MKTLFAIAKELKERAMMGKPEFDWKRDFKGFVGKEVIVFMLKRYLCFHRIML